MIRAGTCLAAAGLLLASVSFAQAAPVGVGEIGNGVSNQMTQVHGGRHRRCEKGRNGWHRHVRRHGEWVRRPCRPWKKKGKRPDNCVKFGPVWYCEY